MKRPARRRRGRHRGPAQDCATACRCRSPPIQRRGARGSPSRAPKADAAPPVAEVLTRAGSMLLPEICIKRPVFATVLSLIILLVGLISYTRLSVREYPRIDEPVVSVQTTYRGASAEVVESQVTKPLEDSLAGIEGVEVMTLAEPFEISQINVRFTPQARSRFRRGRCSRQGRACPRQAAGHHRRA